MGAGGQSTAFPHLPAWLRWLAAHEPDQKSYGLRSGESATAAALARNLVTYAVEHDLGDDEDKACLIPGSPASGSRSRRYLKPPGCGVSSVGECR